MSYQKNEDGTVTISATLRDDEIDGFLLAWGMIVGSMQRLSPPLVWSLLSMMNRFMEGNPNWTQYEIPADRSQPFKPQHVHLVRTPEEPRQ